jgi:hypothetical protein
MEPVELDERELAIAKKAAKLVVDDLTHNFYHSVGKTVVTRFLVIIGFLVVAYAAGKGWISLKDVP